MTNQESEAVFKNIDGMTTQERTEIRDIQNRLIAQCIKRGFTDNDNTGLVDSSGKDITIGNLKQYIYPQFKEVFLEALS